MQADKAHQIPHGFIQEGRVHRVGPVDRHAPGQRGLAAVRLAVDKVAPAADALADQQAERGQIAQGGKRQLFHPAVNQQRDQHADHRAVDRNAAVPDGDDLGRVLAVIAPLEDHIIDARADNAGRHADDQAVDQVVRGDAKLLDTRIDIQRREHKADADDDAVPVDVLAEHIAGNAVQGEFQAEGREGNQVFHG